MNKIEEEQTEYQCFMINKTYKFIVFYTPKKTSFCIQNLPEKKNNVIKTKDSIESVQLIGKKIIIYYSKYFEIYSFTKSLPDTTVVIENIIFQLRQEDDITLYFRKKELLIYKKTDGSIRKQVFMRFIPINKDYVCIISNKEFKNISREENQLKTETPEEIFITIYKRDHSIVFEKTLSSFLEFEIAEEEIRNIFVTIRNKKVYVLLNDRIVGHDLNLYLDELDDFEPTNFTNIENELILFDEKSKILKLFQKNMMNLLFECKTDGYFYDSSEESLHTIKDRIYRVYEKDNLFKHDFKLIENSVYYSEKEDEFDESASSYVDIHH